jgi:hypothetical protein
MYEMSYSGGVGVNSAHCSAVGLGLEYPSKQARALVEERLPRGDLGGLSEDDVDQGLGSETEILRDACEGILFRQNPRRDGPLSRAYLVSQVSAYLVTS